MNLTSLLYLLDDVNSVGDLCSKQAVINITYLIGIVILAIKVAVPIILIVTGMVGLLGAISQQDEKALKTAQGALVKKAIGAVAVFLVATIVGLLMGLIGGNEYEDCMNCINAPFSTSCDFKSN